MLNKDGLRAPILHLPLDIPTGVGLVLSLKHKFADGMSNNLLDLGIVDVLNHEGVRARYGGLIDAVSALVELDG